MLVCRRLVVELQSESSLLEQVVGSHPRCYVGLVTRSKDLPCLLTLLAVAAAWAFVCCSRAHTPQAQAAVVPRSPQDSLQSFQRWTDNGVVFEGADGADDEGSQIDVSLYLHQGRFEWDERNDKAKAHEHACGIYSLSGHTMKLHYSTRIYERPMDVVVHIGPDPGLNSGKVLVSADELAGFELDQMNIPPRGFQGPSVYRLACPVWAFVLDGPYPNTPRDGFSSQR